MPNNDPVDDTAWARREAIRFLGMRRGVLFASKSRRQTNEFQRRPIEHVVHSVDVTEAGLRSSLGITCSAP